jgi:hypothetical protein
MDTEYVDYEDMMNHWTLVFWLGQSYRLDEIRVSARALNVTSGYALGYYTTMNKHIVASVSEMAFRGSSKTVEARLLAYLGFMFMKEKAGNERAVGAVGFSGGSWGTMANYQKFVSLVAIQTASRSFFDTFGTGDQIDMFLATFNLKGSRVAIDMRDVGLSNNEAQMAVVDASQWYGNITEKINAWRTVEVRIADDLEVFFSSLDTTASNFMIGVTCMLSLLFIICVFVIQKGIRLLLNSRAYLMYQTRLRDARNKQKVDDKIADKEQKTAKKIAAAPVAV